ncbi:glycine-rich cell wall structural protein 1.8-like isoform X2 [Neodiprion virginianus]|uniref:glycine-rich cell wall structural protein 1.8-like isoform X2 n=1 Tax=Neodiprion fabricii TaxID=2872261 RepID=UPI001ED8FA50|nr:glycine-rich cell wall structural protein 1.8-like isoform X2 [Neodiprion fabricii]XP_046628473.1 glycine-rich cell wall structural protein 1.8-like isoform X2 [Neodiprion virginianus]
MTEEKKIVSTAAPRKTKIFVGRLPENCRNDELRQLFLRFGEVTECDVMNRYGFVHMAREEDAATAIKTLHNSSFKGATINVEQSTGKSRGGGGGGGARRDGDRRGGPMRGGRGGRDGGRDGRPGPYNDRRGGSRDGGFGGNDRGGRGDFGRRGDFGSSRNGPGAGGGYNDYGNRGGGDYTGRGADFGGGYNDRGGYGQNSGSGLGGYSTSSPGMGGAYGPASGVSGGYGPTATPEYGRGADFGRAADFGARADFGGRSSSMGGDFSRGGPADYGRSDTFGGARTADYPPRNDYDRGVSGPMRNGGATAAYGGGFTEAGGFPAGSGVITKSQGETGGFTQDGPMQFNRNEETPLTNFPLFDRPIGAVPNYSTGPGPQADMFSRRPGSAAPSGGYPPVGGGYSDGYDRTDPYGPRSAGRFPGPADSMPPRY